MSWTLPVGLQSHNERTMGGLYPTGQVNRKDPHGARPPMFKHRFTSQCWLWKFKDNQLFKEFSVCIHCVTICMDSIYGNNDASH